MTAQDAALGNDSPIVGEALKGRSESVARRRSNHIRSEGTFGAPDGLGLRYCPRAAPWAVIACPFGADALRRFEYPHNGQTAYRYF